MKFSKAKIQECVEWVEENGLHPQPCGAKVKQFCEAMGIDDATYRRWSKKADFADAIAHAQKVFKQNKVVEVSNALVKIATGFEFTKTKNEGKPQVVREFDPKTGKKVKEYTTEKIVPVRSVREIVYVEPNVEAIKFFLTNMDPENWKNKQEADVNASFDQDDAPVIVFRSASDSDSKKDEVGGTAEKE